MYLTATRLPQLKKIKRRGGGNHTGANFGI